MAKQISQIRVNDIDYIITDKNAIKNIQVQGVPVKIVDNTANLDIDNLLYEIHNESFDLFIEKGSSTTHYNRIHLFKIISIEGLVSDNLYDEYIYIKKELEAGAWEKLGVLETTGPTAGELDAVKLSVTALDSKVTKIDGRVTSNTNSISTLNKGVQDNTQSIDLLLEDITKINSSLHSFDRPITLAIREVSVLPKVESRTSTVSPDKMQLVYFIVNGDAASSRVIFEEVAAGDLQTPKLCSNWAYAPFCALEKDAKGKSLRYDIIYTCNEGSGSYLNKRIVRDDSKVRTGISTFDFSEVGKPRIAVIQGEDNKLIFD